MWPPDTGIRVAVIVDDYRIGRLQFVCLRYLCPTVPKVELDVFAVFHPKPSSGKAMWPVGPMVVRLCEVAFV